MAKKKTLKQRNLEFLQARGWTVDKTSRVSRYVVLTKSGEERRYFLGNAGAVRLGRTVTASFSVRLDIYPTARSPEQKAALQKVVQRDPIKIINEPLTQDKSYITWAKEERELCLNWISNESPTGPTKERCRRPKGHAGNCCGFTVKGPDKADTAQEVEQRPDPTINSNLEKLRQLPESPPLTIAAEPIDRLTSSGRAQPVSSPLAAAIKRQATPDRSPHVEVQALAGTGKTTTVIEGCKEIKGVKSGLTPSDQQQAVWEAMQAGKHGTVRISSFASKITDELKKRVEQAGLHLKGVEARGIHSLGYEAARKRFGKLSADKAKWVVPDMVLGLLGKGSIKELKGPDLDLVWAVDSLVSLCKQTLSKPTPEEIDALASRYDIDLNGNRSRVLELVPHVLEMCMLPKSGRITFDDMIWLPLMHNLPIFRTDLQIVDEAQDLNRMQQELIYLAGHRIMIVGDENQAIMGFAGADSDSMRKMRKHLNGETNYQTRADGITPIDPTAQVRGCITLPLTVTRRCGKAIVEEARKWVPEYQAHESNPQGAVLDAPLAEGKPGQYRTLAQAGDMVLCRCNAPLVSQCFRFIKEGRKAIILGKKIGEGLTTLVEKSKAQRVPELIAWLGDWLAKETANENAKKYPSEGRLDNLQDKHDCVLAFCDGLADVPDVTRKIACVFTENKDDQGISLSSIHKAKGLEARRVFVLQPKGVGPRQDKMQSWELEAETNLKYVAVTRAIEELRYVHD